MSIFDKECPRDPHDAYREGERSRSYERNPYEHGRYSSDYDCERAYKEFERGRDHAAYERREEERREEEAAMRRDFERQCYARVEEEERQQAMEAEQARYAEQDIRDAEAAQADSQPDAAVESNSTKE